VPRPSVLTLVAEPVWTRDSLLLVLGAESLTGTCAWGKKSKEGPITYAIPSILDKATFKAVRRT